MFNRIARFYISLGLPEFWSISHEDEREGKYYISPNCSLKIFVHPSFRYIEDLLEMAKTKERKIVLESRHNNQKMKFYDYLSENFMTEEETKEEIFLFRQKIIEKSKTKKSFFN